ncbi:MAG: cytochrome c biogenesis protein ResB [Pseudobdellovibrionaceae bacterium]
MNSSFGKPVRPVKQAKILKVIKFLASLKLAVFVIASLAIVSAVGTFVEAKYDLVAAQKLVYKTPYMFVVLGLLAVNLTAVMVDRWPWKRRHVPFILAHIGILVVLLGSVFTFRWGIDGTLRLGIGETNRFVTLPDTEVVVWSSFDGDRFSKVFEQPVDFFLDRPQEKPVSFDLPEGKLVISDYLPYALSSKQVLFSDNPKAGSALRFVLSNPNVNVTEWLVQAKENQKVEHKLGPAAVYLGPIPPSANENAIYLEPSSKDERSLKYKIFHLDGKRATQSGTLKEGETLQTGWMGLEFKVLRYLPRAEEKWEFKSYHRPTPLTNAAIKIEFQGKDHWVQLNDVIKFFTNQGVYFVSYASKRVDIGFDLKLDKFEVGRYQGTMRAASYSSLVSEKDGTQTLISMNEPLKRNGLTFYQASFTEASDGSPNASILSVNYDPGRWVKYLGSLILSLGVVWMFIDRRRASRAQAPKEGAV